MHQLTFSDQSLAELDKLDKDQQLQFVSLISDVAMKEVASKRPMLPMFQRDGKTYYRIKIGTSRVYVEKTSNDSVFLDLSEFEGFSLNGQMNIPVLLWNHRRQNAFGRCRF